MESSIKESVSSVSSAAGGFAAKIAGKRALLGYSGGVDSHVLLYELARIVSIHKISLIALHANHQVLPNSDAWEEHCQQVCKKIGVEFRSQRLCVDLTQPGGKENLLREARYSWFKNIMNPGDILVTAHHLDDQVETVLLRLFRGSGVRGLAGISFAREFGEGELHRPFRDISRSEILSSAKLHDLKWVEDESNHDELFDRNFLRKQAIPIVRSRWRGYAKTIARASEHCARAETLLEQIGEEDLKRWLITPNECRFANFGKVAISNLVVLSPERAANFLRCWSRNVDHEAPGSDRLFELLRQLGRSGEGRKARLAWKSVEFRRYRDYLYLLPAQASRTPRAAKCSMVDPWLDLPTVGLRLRALRGMGSGIRASGINIPAIKICWYNQKIGLRLAGGARTRTLRNLFQEQGIPPWERWRLPILCIDDSVAYVPSIGAAAEFAAGRNEAGIEFVIEER
jgi:tRNA(Ile)-lysidine synthase